MKRIIQIAVALVIAAASTQNWASSTAFAGRLGGPLSTVATAPAGMSVYYDILFVEGEPAMVAISGDGRAMLFVLIYDADGHIASGGGNSDRKLVSMDVYRSGVFRVEVRNIGVRDSSFTLTTN